ncbi:MAG: pilus assembly protein, partial [Acidimicrobiales bacterium]
VTVTVTCVTQLSDVTAPGLPGTKTFSATATAPIDPYSVTNGFSASAGTSGSARSMGGLS